MKPKKGDRIRLKKYPETTGIVSEVINEQVFVDNGCGGSFCFGKIEVVELDQEKKEILNE